jgi:predicted nuclease of predicted toxin-antitoxin system
VTARFVRDLGHNVVLASDLGLSRACDTVLLSRAQQERRIFMTRDKDLGALVFVERLGRGVLLLRITPSTVEATNAELAKVLSSYTEEELAAAFVVIEPGQHRFRRLLA